MRLVRVALSGFLLGVGLYGVPDFGRLLPAPKDEVRVEEPSEEMKKIVSPIEKVVETMTEADKLWLRDIYINGRRVVDADGDLKSPAITDTVVLRKVHITLLEFIWKGMADNAPKKYPSLKSSIDSAMEEAIGLDPKALDDETRDRASDAFNAIAWVANGGR